MKKLLKHCWQRRWVRCLAWCFITLTTLYLLLITWLNRSWSQEWVATVNRLEAEGEAFDIRQLANEPIPEMDNFCAIPILKDLTLAVDNDPNKGVPAANRKRLIEMRLPQNDARLNYGSPWRGKPINLKTCADLLRKDGALAMPIDTGNAASDILSGLSKHDPIVREFAAGLDRPHAQWTPEWKTRELPKPLMNLMVPHYSPIRDANRLLALRAIASARVGESSQAHEATLILARLTQADSKEPLLIGALVAMSNASLTSYATWELCAAQVGTTEDYTKLEAALAELDFRRTCLRAFRGELIFYVDSIMAIKHDPKLFAYATDTNPASAPATITMRALPSGLFDINAALVANDRFEYVIKPLRDQGLMEALKSSKKLEQKYIEIEDNRYAHLTYAASLLFSAAEPDRIKNAIRAQTLVNHAVIACALERHRIASGEYPESLEGLTLTNGQPLPLDIVADKPMSYRRTPDGRYKLWSTGFDGKDDGGKRQAEGKQAKEDSVIFDSRYDGDWVWDFASEPQAQ